jgi:hypothetical protein
MADRLLHALPDADLEAALRGLGPSIAWPTAEVPTGEPDLAAAIRARIEAGPVNPELEPPTWIGWPVRGWARRPARRAVVLALAALLVLAAIAGAVGLGLPGLRIILGQAPGNPPPSASPAVSTGASSSPGGLGASLRLGEALDPTDRDALDARAGFAVALPADPTLGAPAAAYVDDARGGQVTLLWPSGGELPATIEPEVGLLIGQFRGAVNEGFFVKAAGGGSTVERVRVDGHDGFWVSGDPHVLFWDGPGGTFDDARRWVGDVLLWSDGAITYRLESALGRAAAIRIAASMH